MKKKGLSAIVSTLIIILLAIVAFAIVSVVVKQTITKGAQGIEFSGKCLELEVRATKVVASLDDDANPIYSVTISRSAAGNFPIDGVDLIFTDAAEENNVKKRLSRTNIQPLERFTEKILVTELVPVKVEVIPYFLTDEEDNVYYCQNTYAFNIE